MTILITKYLGSLIHSKHQEQRRYLLLFFLCFLFYFLFFTCYSFKEIVFILLRH